MTARLMLKCDRCEVLVEVDQAGWDARGWRRLELKAISPDEAMHFAKLLDLCPTCSDIHRWIKKTL